MNKRLRTIAMASAVTGGMIMSSCTLVKDLEYKVLEDPLEMHGDEVKLKMTATFVEKGLNKKASVKVTPIFVCTDGTEIPFDSREFQGEKAAGNGEVITKAGKTVTYESTRPYQACMEEGEVIVRIEPKKGDKEKDAITTDPIAQGTIITPYLIQLDDQVMVADDNFVRVTSHDTVAVINYDKGKFNVKSSELKQDDIKGLEGFITMAQTNERRDIKGFNIVSFASPEGEIDKNENLASDRATSAEEYLTKFYKKSKIETVPTITKTPKGEDWVGFKAEVEKTTHEDKDLILRVLEMTSDLNKREEDIRNMAKTYTFLEKEVLPQLRRSQIVCTYDKVGWSDDELKQLSKTNPDTLTVEELLYTAELVDDLNEKLRIYNEAERMYGDDWRTSNNVGYILYLQNDVSGAQAKFEKAYELDQNEIVTNNLGAVIHMGGDRARAKELFEQAGSSAETTYNLGLVAIQEGMYGEALEKMGDNQTFNVALAKVLNDEEGAAGDVIDASAEADAAYSYYLKAIIGARTGNNDMVIENLTTAISKDGSYKAKAAKDAEFIKLRDVAAFTALVQ
jgi:tetratricopeptide (TPR) repeat protein